MSWQIVGETFTLFGTGPVPRIVSGGEPVAPAPPPPPPPPPPVDNAPFVWPPEWNAPVDYAARAAWWWLIPGRTEFDVNGKVYVFQAGTGNPVGREHHNAGIIATGRFMGLRLWAPFDAPAAMLRAILTTGQP